MLTAVSISSTDASTSTPLRRASTPYTPTQNSTAARKRNSLRITSGSVPSRQRDSTNESGEEQHGDDFEGDQVRREDRVGHVRRPLHSGEADVAAAKAIRQHGHEHAEEEEADQGSQPLLVVVELDVTSDRRPGEHRPEEKEDDDGADVDEHLHEGDELGG